MQAKLADHLHTDVAAAGSGENAVHGHLPEDAWLTFPPWRKK